MATNGMILFFIKICTNNERGDIFGISKVFQDVRKIFFLLRDFGFLSPKDVIP